MLIGMAALLALAAPVRAQERTIRAGYTQTTLKGLNLTFDAASVKAPGHAARSLFATTEVAAVAAAQARQTMSAKALTFFVQGGLNTTGSLGVAVGAGAELANFMQHEEYALKFDGIWSNAGNCSGCDAFGTIDFSVTQLSFAGAFIYKFDQMSNGWTPFAGGGIVVIRTSFSWDDEFGDLLNFDSSVTHAGIQIQGGLQKARANGKALGVEARVQNAGGGGFLLLAFLGL